MPTISPRRFTSGPPLLPPKITASWPIQRTIWPTSSPSSRKLPAIALGMIICVLLTMPRVTDWETAIGLPIASTTSPTRSPSESPQPAAASGASGRLRVSNFSFSTAMSASGSVPILAASTSSPSARVQVMWVALPAT